jgi:hypothetical protein
LSPNDFRLWLDVGQAREQAGDAAGAEKLCAVLSNSLPLTLTRAGIWLLLRENAQMKRSRNCSRRRKRIRRFACQCSRRRCVYGTDLAALKTAVAHSPATQAELALYLVGRTRVDDALQVWNALSAGEKKEQSATGKAIIKALADARRYRAANAVYRNLAGDGAARL